MSDGLSRRTFLGATAAVGGGALLTACSGSGSGSGSGGGGGGGASGEIVYNTAFDQSSKDPRAVAQTAAIAAFEKANPKIKVKVSVDPGSANPGKAIAARADKPDVWRVTINSMPQNVKQRGVASLDKYIDRDGLDRNDFLLPLSLNQVDGETFSLQMDYRIPLFLYRADAYKAAGARPPATFEDVKRLAGDLSAGGKMWFPIGLGASGGFFPGQAFLEFLGASMLSERSGKLFASNGKDPQFDQAAVQDMATVVKDLYASKASDKAALNWGFTELQQALQTGSAISAAFGLYRFNSLKSSGATDLAWAPAPAFDAAGKQAVNGQVISINNNSKKKDAAWEFAKFMTSAETQANLARGGEVVSRKSTYTNPYFEQPEAKNLSGWKDVVEQRGQAVSYSTNYAAFGEGVSNALTAMILQDGSPQAAADEIMKNYADKIRG